MPDGTHSRDDTEREPHVPRPREGVLPTGDLAVAGNSPLSNSGAVLVQENRSLYELLKQILWDVWVPDLMPAALAYHCEDLVDARDTLRDVHRGHVNLPGFASYGMGFCNRAASAIEEHRDREPMQLVAVGCSGTKHDVDEPVPAQDLYSSSYWSCKRDYGETIGDEWWIISAKHAVLDPADEIERYELVPSDLAGVPADSDQRLPNGEPVETLLDRWALRVYEGLTRQLAAVVDPIDPRDVDLEVLLGRRYRDPLEERGVFDRLRHVGGLDVSFPFQDVEQARGGNGNQMGWMTDQVQAATKEVAD